MKKKLTVIAVIVAVLLVLGCIGFILFKKYAPSFEQKSLEEAYSEISAEEAMIVLNGFPMMDGTDYIKGKVIDGQQYVPLSVAQELNSRLYWDSSENTLYLVTSAGVVRVRPGEMSYQLEKENMDVEHQVLYEDGNVIFVSMDFIKQYTMQIQYASATKPNRIIVQDDFKTPYKAVAVKEDVRLRVGPNKKYAYTLEYSAGSELIVDPMTKEENGYQKVYDMQGVGGYVPTESLGKEESKNWAPDGAEDVFEQLSMGQMVCLGWNQMSDNVDGSEVERKTSFATGLNVISPTWFALNDNKGNISSLGNEAYVSAAHSKGLKVWGLVNDFDKNVSPKKVLRSGASRSNLINNLISQALKYDLDGINIDFERIISESAPAYLEFLRELVVRAHANHLIVSVDDYLPTEGTSFYDWEEQGKIVDYIIFMAYDEHYAGSEEAGSVSSISFVEAGVESGLQYIAPERVVVALPFYTRLWKTTKKGVSSTAYGMSSAETVLQSNGVSPKWDKKTQQYYAKFKSEGSTYQIWLEEENSLEKKLQTVLKKKVAGVGFWKLGFERPATWKMISECLGK